MKDYIKTKNVVAVIQAFLGCNAGDEATEALIINIGCEILGISQDEMLEILDVKDAMFYSVWDGETIVGTPCKVKMVTKEVYDIETADVDGVDELVREYIVIDGVEYPVFQMSDIAEDDEYWYN